MLRTTYRDLISFGVASESTKIKDVKSTIQTKHGIPIALQRLSICGVDLDDDLKLKQIGTAKGTTMDLALYTRKSTLYLLPPYKEYLENCCTVYRPVPRKNIHLNLFVNRKWELSASNEQHDLSEDWIQSNSWVVDVSNEATVLDYSSGCEVFWLRWDGSPSTQPPPPIVQPPSDHTAQLSHTAETYRLMLALKYNNSVAVPFKEAEGYIRKVFESLGVDRRQLLSCDLLNLKPSSYLAIRFLSQTEYQKTARLSIPSIPEAQVIHVVLLYKSLDPESVLLWNSAPPHQADYGEAWQNVMDPEKILRASASSRSNIIASISRFWKFRD
ncbi:ubiquitin family protein [Ceratobasidium sp. AG-Ba]|nr:ubiquitin family protein [Ceratobasidium sp. AG-Ba]